MCIRDSLAALVAVAGAQARAAVPSFDHAIVIVFENKEASDVLGSADAPTFNAMAKRYAVATLPGLLVIKDGRVAYRGKLPDDPDRVIVEILP